MFSTTIDDTRVVRSLQGSQKGIFSRFISNSRREFGEFIRNRDKRVLPKRGMLEKADMFTYLTHAVRGQVPQNICSVILSDLSAARCGKTVAEGRRHVRSNQRPEQSVDGHMRDH